jgi:hypothetical protein
MIKNIYLVRFYSTGQMWHLAACETVAVAKSVCAGYGITETVAGAHAILDGLWWEVVKNPRDDSQSATIHELKVIAELPR